MENTNQSKESSIPMPDTSVIQRVVHRITSGDRGISISSLHQYELQSALRIASNRRYSNRSWLLFISI
ncbi:hypothetical protein [Paenibacillus sp. 1A_MP2]|uniref:hypothetical protein n=1 Tax=Paenibacillus sp. 1A_MP2 TaxID=3457495 RepID=UPI003FCC9A2F